MKLEFKYLAPYLPFNVKCKMKLGPYFEEEISVIDSSNYWHIEKDHSSSIIPFLYSIESLICEIEINGTKFIPLIELAKIAESRCANIGEMKLENGNYFLAFSDNNGMSFVFGYFSKTKSFLLHSNIINSIGDSVYPANQFELFQKLCEWHIDFQDLIGQGLAIDINTLTA